MALLAMSIIIILPIIPLAKAQQQALQYLEITQGIASGDVTSNSAVIWSRSNQPAIMVVDYSTDPTFSERLTNTSISAEANWTTDFAAHTMLQGLRPDTDYYYRVTFTSADRSQMSESMNGTFRTAPEDSVSKEVGFAVGGDLAGQRYCSRVDIGYPIFSAIKELAPDFFVANGDLIYADNDCPANGPDNVRGWKNLPGNFLNVTDPDVDWTNSTQLHELYLNHWEYNRADPHFQSLLRNVSVYSQADDHEVANDYSGTSPYYTNATKDREGFRNLISEGMNVFFNFSPIERNEEEPHRIYRSFNWGKDLDLFVLDAHSYRSPNYWPETPGSNKTLLRDEQLNWLKQGLANSTSTWKAILIDVPVTIPNCSNQTGCDNWATDGETNQTYTRERSELLKFMDENNIKNVVFVVTDTHFPANIRVEEDADGDGDALIFHELVSGPLNAGTFGPDPLDPTINAKYLYKETGFFNFGYYRIQPSAEPINNETSHFIAEIRTADGLLRPESHMEIMAEE
jgi:alkaline phosphatase D